MFSSFRFFGKVILIMLGLEFCARHKNLIVNTAHILTPHYFATCMCEENDNDQFIRYTTTKEIDVQSVR